MANSCAVNTCVVVFYQQRLGALWSVYRASEVLLLCQSVYENETLQTK